MMSRDPQLDLENSSQLSGAWKQSVLGIEALRGVAFPEKKYFRIGEVAKFLGVQAYVVRFWEKEFAFLKPETSPARQRLYSREGLESLVLVKFLLYQERYSIEGARRRVKELEHEGQVSPFEASQQLVQTQNLEFLQKAEKLSSELLLLIHGFEERVIVRDLQTSRSHDAKTKAPQ